MIQHGMKLGFAAYDFKGYAPTPPPMYNAGQYTGNACAGDWCPVPVKPDAAYMTTVALRGAGPPPGATTQPAGAMRPGNNYYEPPGYGLAYGSIVCAPTVTQS